MKYATPVDKRQFVGFRNYIDVFKKDECFSALKLSLYYMAGAMVQLVLALYLATILSFKTKFGNMFKGLDVYKRQAMYHKYNDLIRRGDYSRIASFLENGNYDCYQVTSKDQKEALVTYVQVLSRPNFHSRRVRLKGLAPEKQYRIEETGEIFGGDVLMQAGLLVTPLWGDYRSKLIHLTEV